MTEQEFEIIETMRKYGGGFVQALAECFMRADHINFAKLRLAFDNYWTQYKDMKEAITNTTL